MSETGDELIRVLGFRKSLGCFTENEKRALQKPSKTGSDSTV
jgi:hypothetical protein